MELPEDPPNEPVEPHEPPEPLEPIQQLEANQPLVPLEPQRVHTPNETHEPSELHEPHQPNQPNQLLVLHEPYQPLNPIESNQPIQQLEPPEPLEPVVPLEPLAPESTFNSMSDECMTIVFNNIPTNPAVPSNIFRFRHVCTRWRNESEKMLPNMESLVLSLHDNRVQAEQSRTSFNPFELIYANDPLDYLTSGGWESGNLTDFSLLLDRLDVEQAKDYLTKLTGLKTLTVRVRMKTTKCNIRTLKQLLGTLPELESLTVFLYNGHKLDADDANRVYLSLYDFICVSTIKELKFFVESGIDRYLIPEEGKVDENKDGNCSCDTAQANSRQLGPRAGTRKEDDLEVDGADEDEEEEDEDEEEEEEEEEEDSDDDDEDVKDMEDRLVHFGFNFVGLFDLNVDPYGDSKQEESNLVRLSMPLYDKIFNEDLFKRLKNVTHLRVDGLPLNNYPFYNPITIHRKVGWDTPVHLAKIPKKFSNLKCLELVYHQPVEPEEVKGCKFSSNHFITGAEMAELSRLEIEELRLVGAFPNQNNGVHLVTVTRLFIAAVNIFADCLKPGKYTLKQGEKLFKGLFDIKPLETRFPNLAQLVLVDLERYKRDRGYVIYHKRQLIYYDGSKGERPVSDKKKTDLPNTLISN